MTESTKGGFLVGILVGVTAGVLLAPRRAGREAAGEEPLEAAWEETAAPAATDERAAALNRRIEETRRRLREQIGS